MRCLPRKFAGSNTTSGRSRGGPGSSPPSRSTGRRADARAQGFGARVDQGRLTYQFMLPIQGKGAARGTVDVVVDDPELLHRVHAGARHAGQGHGDAPFVAECQVVREKAAYTFDVIKCTYTRRGR